MLAPGLVTVPASSQQSPASFNQSATSASTSQSRQPAAVRVSEAQAESENQLAEQRELQRLRNLDRQVRAHELAHVAVGGRYVTSGASFDYQTGPDGRRYAVGGEVSIDTSEVPGNPQATLDKALVVLRAALAPANPSAQDRRVAAEAAAAIQQARIDLTLQDDEQNRGLRLDTYA
jgi:hypothetical protein